MAVPDQIFIGESYDFSQTLNVDTDVGGGDVSGFTYQLDVKQFPDDTAAISKTLTDVTGAIVKGTLTPFETSTLARGLWYLIITSTDFDETIQTTRRIQLKKSWV